MKPEKIYIAGPITAPTEDMMIENVQRAMNVCMILLKMGHVPFCPHLTYYLDVHANNIGVKITWDEYMRWDDEWLKLCDSLYFIAPSPGANVELERAKERGLKIYKNLAEVPAVEQYR